MGLLFRFQGLEVRLQGRCEPFDSFGSYLPRRGSTNKGVLTQTRAVEVCLSAITSYLVPPGPSWSFGYRTNYQLPTQPSPVESVGRHPQS